MEIDPIETKNEAYNDAYLQTKQRPRSEARARYYKPSSDTYSRRRHETEKAEKTSFQERFTLQAIICGGFLALLLLFNIVDSSFTNNITGWIEQNLSYDMLAEEDGVGGWVNAISAFFADEGHPQEPGIHYETPPQAEATPMPHVDTNSSPDTSRIDENILHEINTAVDAYNDIN